ncbi:uncharacterized protein PG986_000234 [Apiospora aurea]|uniref:Uncharacterized protein n=1 Tax=Apiospora aurea TaxID=335848 RepID=A0ABR1QTT6_9PEZI
MRTMLLWLCTFASLRPYLGMDMGRIPNLRPPKRDPGTKSQEATYMEDWTWPGLHELPREEEEEIWQLSHAPFPSALLSSSFLVEKSKSPAWFALDK